jgi:cyclopropane-fatty-acyl-phospholipid synthase
VRPQQQNRGKIKTEEFSLAPKHKAGIMPILSRSADQWLLGRISKAVGPAPIRIVLGDGGATSSVDAPVATVIIPDRKTLARLLLDPEMAFCDAYADGTIQVQGNLIKLLEAIYQGALRAQPGGTLYSRLASQWMSLLQSNSLLSSRRNIHAHYDIGNNFYKLWLDRQLVYTCAYFPTPAATLEQAQTAKMEHICRKLRLQPGEAVVEAGCGWGALAIHMARQYGVTVKAFNVSHEQILFARQQAEAEGLSHQVEFIEDDYRNISGKFDVFVSVGMLEHVGVENYQGMADAVRRSVGESGRGLLHFIGRNRAAVFSRWMEKRIFPGAYIPALRQALEIFERWNYSVLDVENLRLHYAKTLEHWLDRFEKSQQQVAAMYDSEFLRAWRLYLAGSLVAFQCGTLQLFQVVFAGSRCRPVWWTRAPLYTEAQSEIEKPECVHAMS